MERVRRTVFLVIKNLMIWVLVYTALGLALGTVLDLFISKNERVFMYVGFVGEIFRRLLKCFTMPLLASFIISTTGGFKCFMSKRVVSQFVCTVFLFNLEAVILSMAITTVVHPGDYVVCIKNILPKARNITIEDQYLDMFRNIFPDNTILILSNVFKTTLVPTDQWDLPENLRHWKIEAEAVDMVNVLGLISVSIAAGIAMKVMGEKNKALLDFVDCIFSVCLVILRWLAFVAPLGILSLLAEDVMHCGILDTLEQIGCYILTFCIIYSIQMLIVYPLVYMVLFRRNIFSFYSQIPCVRASLYPSSIILPATINYFQQAGYDPNLVNFVLTMGNNVNKSGAAAFMPIVALFIAQKHDYPFGVAEYTICGLLSIIVSTAVPPIQFGTLMLSVAVLYGLGYPMSDLGIFFCVDWLRYRTELLTSYVCNCIILSIINRMNENHPDKILDKKTQEAARQAREQQEAEQEETEAEEETEA